MSSTNANDILEKLERLLSRLITDINDLKKEIDTLRSDVNEIRTQVNEIHQNTLNIENIQKSAVKLDEHIDKINGIYESVKDPFHKVMNIISWDTTNLIGF